MHEQAKVPVFNLSNPHFVLTMLHVLMLAVGVETVRGSIYVRQTLVGYSSSGTHATEEEKTSRLKFPCSISHVLMLAVGVGTVRGSICVVSRIALIARDTVTHVTLTN